MQKVLAIAGATASGKSDVAIKLAKKLNGEIISMDSMQIYRNMNIGTAKISSLEMDNIPHHMIDIVNPESSFSVSDFVKIAKEIIIDITNRGKLPMLVGGTGLYFESLIYPFNFGCAKSDEKIKAKLYSELEQYGEQYLHNKLKAIDPIDAEKIHPNNTKRLIRALEIFELTGNTKSNSAQSKNLVYDIDMYVLDWNREILYDRIKKRVDIMFKNGLLEEVTNLIKNGLTFDMQSMQGIGYKEFKGYFEQKCDINQVKNSIILNSRHYAKRQITWFKRYKFATFISPQELLNKFLV